MKEVIMTDQELEDFKKKAKQKYKKVNQIIKDKCYACGKPSFCDRCNFNFSKFLMRSILVDDNCICRKCNKWLTNLCYNQGTKANKCNEFSRITKGDTNDKRNTYTKGDQR